MDFVCKWIKDHCFPLRNNEVSASGRVCAARLWQRYREGGHPLARALRAAVPCSIYFLLAGIIYQLFGSPFQPLRGGNDHAIIEWANFKLPPGIRGYMVVNLFFFFLTFMTIDAALLCRQFIQQLSAGNVVFPPATRAHFQHHRGDVSGEYLDDWIGTRLIADLTERVGKLLWFPGIVFLLLLMARLPWWDHWPWHPAHIIIMILNFCIALASVVILQRAARAAKSAAEERLTAKVKRLQAQTAPSPAHNDAAQAEKLLDEIRNIHHGAFGSILGQPGSGCRAGWARRLDHTPNADLVYGPLIERLHCSAGTMAIGHRTVPVHLRQPLGICQKITGLFQKSKGPAEDLHTQYSGLRSSEMCSPLEECQSSIQHARLFCWRLSSFSRSGRRRE